ncbi:ubiquitin-like 7, partial [Clonorchis sinensis]
QAIVSHPEIGRDATAYSILQDPKFLSVVLRDQAILDKLIAVHPCILSALRLATQNLSSLNENLQAKPVSHRNVMTSTTSLGLQDYTVDQNLEDDVEDDTDANASRQPSGSSPVLLTPYRGPGDPDPDSSRRTAQSTGPNTIERNSPRVSRHQLQAAIAQAQGLLSGSGLHVSPASSSQLVTDQVSGTSMSPTTNSATPRITSSALSRALASVPSLTARQNLPTTSSSSAASHTAEPIAVHTESRWATQLAQLAEMGVTDELAARQALEATNGDIALAVQLLFG